ncbi:MAG: hypothetical protein WCG99_00030 [Candidatus Berkelbacteria bacterium]
MSDDTELNKTDIEKTVAPATDMAVSLEPQKKEIVRTPEAQERLINVVGRVSMSQRGKFFEEYRAENEAAADFLTRNSLKVAEARGLDIPAEYLDNVQTMIDRLNEKSGTGLTMNEDAIAKIVAASPEDLPGLYKELLVIVTPFDDRENLSTPEAAEIAGFIEAAKAVIDRRDEEDRPLDRVRELCEIMFDVEGTRRDEDGESVLPADDIEVTLFAHVDDIVDSGNETGVNSITSEDLITLAYSNLKKKKVPTSWAKVPRDIRTNIELAVQRVKEDHADNIDVLNTSEGPIITFKPVEK